MSKIRTSKSVISFKDDRTYKQSVSALLIKEYKLITLLSEFKTLKKYLSEKLVLKKEQLSYNFIQGSIAGGFLTDYGYKSGLFTREKFKEFISFHYNVSQIKDKKILKLADTYTYKTALSEIAHYKKNNPEILSVQQWDLVYKKIVDNKDVFETKNTVLTQFDLYPENILMTQDLFKAIDWESTSLVSKAFIPAFFNLLFWREKIWRDISLKTFNNHNSKLFNRSYSVFSVILAIRLIYQLRAYTQINDAQNQATNWFYNILHTYLYTDVIKLEDFRFCVTEPFISSVCNKNKLGKLVTFYVYEKSYSNIVIKIETEKKAYIVKFFSTKKTDIECKNEIKIIKYLKKKELPVYQLLTGIKKINYLGFTRCYFIAEYISGQEVTRHSFSVEHVKNMGKMLGQMHLYNVIHGDFSKRNLLFNGKTISGILDLEYSDKTLDQYQLQLDLAHSIVLLLISYSASYIPFNTRIKYFLNSYIIQFNKVQFNMPKLQQMLVEQAFSELNKYKKINPQGDTKKYVEVINFVKNFNSFNTYKVIR